MAEERDVKETMDMMEKSRVARLVQAQRDYFANGRTLDLGFRRERLLALSQALEDYEDRLLDALHRDLGKAAFEGYATELLAVKEELGYILRNFKRWARKESFGSSVVNFPSHSSIYKEPLGVTLILSPWNYPLNLALTPLVSAIAAGNCALIKPSRHAAQTAAVMGKMLGEYFDPGHVALVESGENTNEALLLERFDHIFFTGSPAVGKIIMKAASKNLTPVTLELGGKSPCIVDRTARIDMAARRIVWGKCINAGQTCVAPDYVLVEESVKEKLIRAIEKYIIAFYGSQPLTNSDLPSIINDKHFNRLQALLDHEKQNIRYGGETDPQTRKIAPAILTDVDPESPVMQEEIFGPILPVLSFSRFEEAENFVRQREKPLALYLFTGSLLREKRVMKRLSFGGGCVNDTVMHLAESRLPFGGVGRSGMGAYHGKRGFDTFTHEKSVIRKSQLVDIPLRYPPYDGKLGLLKLSVKLMGFMKPVKLKQLGRGRR